MYGKGGQELLVLKTSADSKASGWHAQQEKQRQNGHDTKSVITRPASEWRCSGPWSIPEHNIWSRVDAHPRAGGATTHLLA